MKSQTRDFLISLREDMTGPALFNPQSYLFFLPVFWITSLLANARLDSLSSFLVWTLANATAMLSCWLLIWVVDKKVIPNRSIRPAKLAKVLALATIIGAVKGGVTTLLVYSFGFENSLSVLPGRVAQTAFLGLVTIPALAVFAASRSRLQTERDAIIYENINRELRDGSGKTTEVELLRRELSELASSDAGEKAMPPLLREIVRVNLRPVTHRLWDKQNEKLQEVSIAALSKVAMLSHPFVGLPVALILSIGSFVPYLVRTGLAEAVGRSSITFVVIILGYFVASKWQPKFLSLAVLYFLVANLAIACGIVWSSSLIFGDLNDYSIIGSSSVLFIWMAQTGYMTSFFKRAFATRAEVRKQLQELSKTMGLNAEAQRIGAAIANRELANHLHSNVQNRLLALALNIEQGRGISVYEELEEIDQLLAGSRTTSRTHLTQDLRDLRDRWAGIALVKFDELEQQVANPEVILQAITEAVNNAIRHGLATKILVSFEKTTQAFVVTVRDDGIGPRQGERGLGSLYFDSITGGRWSLTPRESGGAVLVLEIAN